MYKDKDPHAVIFAAGSKPPQTGLIAEEQIAEFHKLPPQEKTEGRKPRLECGCNFVLAYGEAEAGAVFARHQQPDEYVVLLPDAPTMIEANGETPSVAANFIVFVPPGISNVTLPAGGTGCASVHDSLMGSGRALPECRCLCCRPQPYPAFCRMARARSRLQDSRLWSGHSRAGASLQSHFPLQDLHGELP